jgi:hypothetical protein
LSRSALFASFLVLAGCGTPCAAPAPLGAVPEAPRWAVRFNDRPPDPEPSMPLPGMEEEVRDPLGAGTYATIGLYADPTAGGAPVLLHERWMDSTTTWEGATGSIDASTRLPMFGRVGELLFALTSGTRSVVSLALVGPEPGRVILDVPTRVGATAGVTGGALYDLAPIDLPEIPGPEQAIASRLRASDGIGDDLVLLDLRSGVGEEAGVVRAISLSTLASGTVGPAQVVPLPNELGVSDRALVALGLPDEGAGAVAIVSPETGAAFRFDLPGLARCAWAVRLTPLASAPNTARVGVACVGDVTLPPNERRGAGLALLTIPPDAGPSVEAIRPLSSLYPERPPTGPMVALAGDWVAIVSRGMADGSRPDTLFAFDLSSDAGAPLDEEYWTPGYGEGLGEGAFAPELGENGELWWPSVSRGIVRIEMFGGTGVDAQFRWLDDAARVAPLPGCARSPARVIRRLPASAPPPVPDAGVEDAGTEDSGVPDAA